MIVKITMMMIYDDDGDNDNDDYGDNNKSKSVSYIQTPLHSLFLLCFVHEI